MIKLYKGARLRSRRKHYIALAALWLYTLLWLIGLGAYAYWFQQLSALLKILLLAPLVLGTPALSDLFYPYGKYQWEWQRDNER
jgi:hypothetical protein